MYDFKILNVQYGVSNSGITKILRAPVRIRIKTVDNRLSVCLLSFHQLTLHFQNYSTVLLHAFYVADKKGMSRTQSVKKSSLLM